jgi:hypothetical protein
MLICDIAKLHLFPKTKGTGSGKFVKDTQFSQIFWEKGQGICSKMKQKRFGRELYAHAV